MAHRNARLTPRTRLELVREVEAGFAQAEVARRFRVSRATVAKWVRRHRQEGAPGLDDRSSAPHRHPRRTSAEAERRICAVRRSQGWGPHRIEWALGVARSTVYVVLRRHGLSRLDRLHRVSRQPVRYEHPAPGDLLHLDVKKLGRIPEGGGKRIAPGFAETRSGPHSRRSLGVEYLHVAVDDHSRYAYVAVLPDERGPSCAAFLEQALAAFERRGVRVRRVLTDNARAYTVARRFRAVADAAGVRLKHTRPYRPQTNGKAERFIQILQDEWAYARPYRSNAERLRALPRWLYRYNHRRPHGGVGGAVPASRL
jgi:transposase InsO family protein